MRLSVCSLALVAGFVAGAAPLVAQSAPNRDAVVEYRKQFMSDLDSLNAKVVQLANAFPADKYSWRPMPGVRSVGEVLMHIASEYYVYTPLAFGGNRSQVIPRGPETFANFEKNASKDSVLFHLAQGYAYLAKEVNGMDPEMITGTRKLFGGDHTVLETGISMTADLHEHLGQLIAYARMNGVKPPWSK